MSDKTSNDSSLDEHRIETERRDRAWRNHLAEMVERIAKLNAPPAGHYIAGSQLSAGWAVYDKDGKHVAGPFIRYVEAVGECERLNGSAP